jgi:hypothetical protein
VTRDEILDMKPGIELNIEVAEKVMENRVVNDEILGYLERPASPKTNQEEVVSGSSDSSCNTCCGSSNDGTPGWGTVERYSEEISAAMLVVNKMIDRGFKDARNWRDFGGGKYTEAEAICKAALLAVSEKQISKSPSYS